MRECTSHLGNQHCSTAAAHCVSFCATLSRDIWGEIVKESLCSRAVADVAQGGAGGGEEDPWFFQKS